VRVSLRRSTPTEVVYQIDDSEISVSCTRPLLQASGDAQIALGLLPALRSGQALRVDQPVSAQFAANLPMLRSIFANWLDQRPVDIDAPVDAPAGRGGGVGSFFSCGVDSFYTALLHAHEITALIFEHGFDIRVEDHALSANALDHARRAAADLGKELIEIRTDVRRYEPIGEDWVYTNGAAMAMVAHSLGGVLGRVYIPASFTYKDMFPAGSHPMSDPLWSGTVDLVHDGADTTRMGKVAAIAGSEAAARHLRVCWENRGGRFNCCECEKCTRTMISLRAVGALERYRTFDRPLRLRRVRYGLVRDVPQATFTRQILAELEARGTDPDLARALRWRLRIGPKRQALRRGGYRLYRGVLDALTGRPAPETLRS